MIDEPIQDLMEQIGRAVLTDLRTVAERLFDAFDTAEALIAVCYDEIFSQITVQFLGYKICRFRFA